MQQGMDFADQVQRWKFGFTSLMNDEAKGIAHLRDLLKYGKDSAFATEDVVNYAQQLEAVRIKATEVVPALEAIGGALARAGNFTPAGLESAVRGFKDILSKNQVSAEEMTRQIGQVIPDPYGIAARGFNRLGYKTDAGAEFTSGDVRKLGEEGRLNADAFVRIMFNEMRETSKGILDKFVSSTISGTQAQLEDTKLFLFAKSMLGGGDMLGAPGGAYAQRLQNLKTQTGLYSGPEAEKIGKNLGGTAEKYYGLVGTIEENMFQSDWFTDLLHGDTEGAKAKMKMLGGYIPQGLKDGITSGSKMVVDAAASVMGSTIWDALEAFWQTNSPSKKAMKMGEWIAEGLEIGLNKKQAGNYANLQKLSQQSPDFMRKLGETAARLGTNPDYLLNVFARESSLNPNAYNPSGGTGLFQLMPMHAHKLGLPGGPNNKDAFRQSVQSLGATGQLDLFYRYITEIVGVQNFKDQASAYASVFMPKYTNASADAVVAQRGTKNYSQNTGLDRNKDGLITKRELGLEAEGALGAGKFFSVNGQLAVSKGNPMPVTIIDYGNGVDYRSGPSAFYDPNYKDSGLTNQINAARGMYAARPGSHASIGMLTDTVPVNAGSIYAQAQELTTSMVFLQDTLDNTPLYFKKPLELLGESATAAGAALGLTKATLESEFGAPITGGGKQQGRISKQFRDQFTWEGIGADFGGGLSSLLSDLPFEHNKGSLAKQFAYSFARDAWGRMAHDLSAQITGALFGSPKGGNGEDANKLAGGLLSKLFGSLFGGGRASGGGMAPGRFYLAGEHGQELIAGPGHVYNARETQQIMSGGGGNTQVFLALGDHAVGQMNDAWLNRRSTTRKMIKVNARYRKLIQSSV